MYERFTDRARKVVQLANREAKRFNHEYIGTEHILLGLLKEGSATGLWFWLSALPRRFFPSSVKEESSAGINVLKTLNVDPRRIILEVEKIVQSGPDMLLLGRLPLTPRSQNVIAYSIEEARGLNHDYVGTGHLLLGLLRDQQGVAAQVLMNLGLWLEDVRKVLATEHAR